MHGIGQLLLIGCTAAAPAVELLLGHVEYGLDLPPLAFDFALDDGIDTREGSDGFDYGFGSSIGAIRAFPGPGSGFGFYLAGHGVINRMGLDDGALTTIGARGSAGMAWALGDRWIVAAGPVVEAGYGRLALDETRGHAAFDGDGYYGSVGGELRAQLSLTERWALSLRAGYLMADHGYEDGDLALDLDQAGAFAGIGLGYRFATLPSALE